MENKEVVERMNAMLIGQHGIAMLTGRNQFKHLGALRSVELKSYNVLFTFSEHNVMFSSMFQMVSIVGNQQEDGSFPGKAICDSLYIGNKSLEDIFKNIFEK